MTFFRSGVTVLNQLLLTFTNSALHSRRANPAPTDSADFLPDFFGCRQPNSAFGASCKTSWDKPTRFQRVMPDLPKAVTVGFRDFAIRSPLALRCSALYQVSVRHYGRTHRFAPTICSHPQHPCRSLTLPFNGFYPPFFV
jgi:hypothetical protein